MNALTLIASDAILRLMVLRFMKNEHTLDDQTFERRHILPHRECCVMYDVSLQNRVSEIMVFVLGNGILTHTEL